MRKLFDNPYFVGVLVAIALFVLFGGSIKNWIQKSGKSSKPETIQKDAIYMASQSSVQIESQPQPIVLSDVKIDVNSIQWILKPSRNPFQKFYTVSDTNLTSHYEEIITNDKPMVLSAILIEKGKKYSVINNRVLVEGEIIGGYKIEKIDRDHVILVKPGAKRKLDFEINAQTTNEQGKTQP